MPLIELAPSSGRCLSFVEREDIALLRAQTLGGREIARRIERSPSTVSRELRRNAATRGGRIDYRVSISYAFNDQQQGGIPHTRAAAGVRGGTSQTRDDH